MKKNILLILVAVLFASALNAQFFIGGALEFDVQSDKEKNGSVTSDLDREVTLKIAPKGGFYLNDEMAVGTSIGYELTRTTTPANGNNGFETIETQNTLNFAPFFRYYALDFGPISLFGEAFISFGFGASKTKVGSVTSNNASVFTFGAGVLPGASYKLTESIEIEAFLGGLKFYRVTHEENNIKNIDSNFNISLSSDFGLGFIYKL